MLRLNIFAKNWHEYLFHYIILIAKLFRLKVLLAYLHRLSKGYELNPSSNSIHVEINFEIENCLVNMCARWHTKFVSLTHGFRNRMHNIWGPTHAIVGD